MPANTTRSSFRDRSERPYREASAHRDRAPGGHRGGGPRGGGRGPSTWARDPIGADRGQRGSKGAQRSSPLAAALDAAAAGPEPAPVTFGELGLPAPLVSVLAEQGIAAPFAIQSRVLPDALAGRDVLARARTGSGKTLAFGLPVLVRLAGQAGAAEPRRPRALVLVPTRELAQQVADVLVPLARPLGLWVATVYGGASIERQISRLARGVDVVVATPGRLIDLMERRACLLDGIQASVLDEADHMADLGFLPSVRRILDATPVGAQRLLLSATLDGGVHQLVTDYLKEPAVHATATPEEEHADMRHRVLAHPVPDKVEIAAQIAARPARTLFFVRTRHGADRLVGQFAKAGVEAAAIHGSRSQGQRQRALDGFAAGRPRVLVATDVAARGIHVEDVDLVVHYDLPTDHKDYLHRSGRTARAGAAGTVVALVDGAGSRREVERLHRAAGVRATLDEVHAGHGVVLEIGASGEQVVVSQTPTRPGLKGERLNGGERSGRSRAGRRPAGRKPGGGFGGGDSGGRDSGGRNFGGGTSGGGSGAEAGGARSGRRTPGEKPEGRGPSRRSTSGQGRPASDR